ncbi:hypothetical protein BAUCODRAFT_518093 [Baudoinia panamericana UAMH 10762]|uniref:Uncharacterized protein n=1 Tax=Baudoinia panamericana (strain UAMH 10762) TaxID=717646 RepID=M2NAG5_BAUPA|nr:uncharacterized protein BAUCODRAFT_518093 [Baudoinia panamericana UAMH 10762]EMC96124.1 hypothetical protein BAUCODRAFT_518093 [Baudoinia panamericana UAMH 10762]
MRVFAGEIFVIESVFTLHLQVTSDKLVQSCCAALTVATGTCCTSPPPSSGSSLSSSVFASSISCSVSFV